MSALNVLCAQLTRDLFAIAKFLFNVFRNPKTVTFYFFCFVASYVFSQTIQTTKRRSLYALLFKHVYNNAELWNALWLADWSEYKS